VEREVRRRLKEIRRRRGKNVHQAPEVRVGWDDCRRLSLAHLDAVIALHAAGGGGAVPAFGKYAHLSPPEQEVLQDADHQGWVRHMETTPWFPGRTLGEPSLEALEDEIFAAWGTYTFQCRLHEEKPYSAGFDVQRARLYRAGATAIGVPDQDELAKLEDGGVDLSGTRIEVTLPPEALRILGADWPKRYPVPRIDLRTWQFPDWEFPGYWLLEDNRVIAPAALADLLEDHAQVTEAQRTALRGR
jgi:hypothetical protein